MDNISLFLEDFLLISNLVTLGFLVILFFLFSIIKNFEKKRATFSKRVLVGMLIGLLLGILIQVVSGFPEDPSAVTWITETTSWYTLIGNGYMDLIRMLVIPLVMVSIIHVIINMEDDINLSALVSKTIMVTMGMVALSAVVGLSFGLLFNIGGNTVTDSDAAIKEISTLPQTLRGLLPSNPAKSMVELNIIAIVIFSIFIGIGAKRMKKKYFDVVKPFYDLINALHKIIISIAMSIIKLMPYAVIPLLANTIALRGLQSILDVGMFIIVLYLALGVMFIIQLILLMLNGLNPVYYIKKSVPVFTLAFTSRSSVGTLPLTIETLVNKLGVNSATANFVASFGTTAGMQGCAGVFPSLLIVYVANTNGVPIDFTLVLMSIIIVAIGSLGIAGIPGTATMAASVALSGVGMSQYFSSISPILSIDPLIDMGRTFINVTGSLTNALVVDKSLKQLDIKAYEDMSLVNIESEFE